MAVALPNTVSGTVVYEYAATSINFNRQVINVNGVMTPTYTCSIPYSMTGYLTDSNNNKVAIVSSNNNLMQPSDPNSAGNIYLDATKVATLFSQMPPASTSVGDIIANMADSLIHDDLVARGVLKS